MLSRHAFAVIAAGSAFVATPASAAAILVGQWYTFGFGGAGSALVSGTGFILGTNPASVAAPGGPWTFTLAGAGTLTLLDGFNIGDRFNVTDFGGSIGDTSLPVGGGSCGNDITACLAAPGNSKGVFALAAGAHSIAGTTILSPFGGGAGFFRVQDDVVVDPRGAVPEPGVWLMMLIGFGLVGAGLRHRNTTVRVRYT